MPSHSYHKDKYLHNKDFLSEVNQERYPDWKITVCFYCCLHKMCQCLHYVYNATDEDLKSHTSTQKYIAAHNRTLILSYGRMYSLSKTSRYEYTDMSSRVEEATSLLSQIENACDNLISNKTMQLVKS